MFKTPTYIVTLHQDLFQPPMGEVVVLVTVLSGLVAVLGSISNALSLSFFARSSRSNSRKEGFLTRRLFICLNTTDLLVCVSVFGCSFQYFIPPDIGASVVAVMLTGLFIGLYDYHALFAIFI